MDAAWLLEILRREHHRPRADYNDEHLGAMFDAAFTGDFNQLRAALVTLTQSREQVDVSMLHEYGGWDRHVTPLHAAASGGHLDAATLLIALGADLEASVGQAGGRFTPLHHAAGFADPAMVRLLLDSGADVTALFSWDLQADEGNAAALALAPHNDAEATVQTLNLLFDHGLGANERSANGEDRWLCQACQATYEARRHAI
ncbi:hypothetical protein RB596_007318 [Gaeumannomyces avenae]